MKDIDNKIIAYLEQFKTQDKAAKAMLEFAAKEIRRLEKDKDFWYKAGYEAGLEDQKVVS
jgi:hypothetical protein